MDTKGSKDTQYLTTDDVAKKLNLHWQTVLDLIRSNYLPAIKIGKSYRIESTEFENFIRERTIKGTFKLKEFFDERAKEILERSIFQGKRVLVLGFGFPEPAKIIDLFASQNKGAAAVLLESTKTRQLGWHVDAVLDQQPKPVNGGEFLELADKSRCIRVYRDGMCLASGLLDNNFLGWGIQQYDEENQEEKGINALAVCEFIANFAIKVSLMLNLIIPKPKQCLASVMIYNPKANKLSLKYKSNDIFEPERIGDSFQLKEQRLSNELTCNTPEDILQAGATLWKDFGHIFGLLDDRIPLLNANKTEIDIDEIRNKK